MPGGTPPVLEDAYRAGMTSAHTADGIPSAAKSQAGGGEGEAMCGVNPGRYNSPDHKTLVGPNAPAETL